MTPEDPVEIYAARDTPEAHFVRNLLAEAGIEATVVGDSLGAALNRVIDVATPRIWVHAVDAPRARPIIAEYQRHLIDRVETGSAAEAPPGGDHAAAEPFCYHCGQAVSQGQSPCPTCGQELDWSSR